MIVASIASSMIMTYVLNAPQPFLGHTIADFDEIYVKPCESTCWSVYESTAICVSLIQIIALDRRPGLPILHGILTRYMDPPHKGGQVP